MENLLKIIYVFLFDIFLVKDFSKRERDERDIIANLIFPFGCNSTIKSWYYYNLKSSYTYLLSNLS